MAPSARCTLGVWVNLDDASLSSGGVGALVTLADASTKLAQVSYTADWKARGYIRTAVGSSYTLTSPSKLHPGFNLITLSYDKGVVGGIKLGVNGKVVASTDAPPEDLFNDVLAACIGATQNTSGAISEGGDNAVVDDVFLAQGVLSDAALWDIYMAYITAAPLMKSEAV